MSFLNNLKIKILNDNFFIQLGHGAGGYGMIFTSLFYGHNWHQLLYGWIIILLWTFPKEYIFDIYVEKQSYVDGWIDQKSYFIGGVIASLIFIFNLYI